MLVALVRASARRHRAAGFLEAPASTQWQSVDPVVKAAAAEATPTPPTTTSTSSPSRSFFAAVSTTADSSALSPSLSRGFAAKAHKNKKKGRGGGNKRNDSDSEDEESASSSSRGGRSATAAATTSSFNLEATRNKMSTSLERLKKALSGLHAGRASPSMLEHISVTIIHTNEGEASSSSSSSPSSSPSSSSSHIPLQALAAVTARDANTLVVTPFDPSPATAAAIAAALKLPPLRLNNVRQERSGELVVPVPRATPEAVAALAKLARGEAEAARVAVRSARKEANRAISSGGGEGGDDAKRRSEKSVQAAADEFVKKIDAALAAKEADLAAV